MPIVDDNSPVTPEDTYSSSKSPDVDDQTLSDVHYQQQLSTGLFFRSWKGSKGYDAKGEVES